MATARKRLIFFTVADPGIHPERVLEAYHLATTAAKAGLEAEVRLAGDAVRVALPDGIAATPRGDDLRTKVLLRTEPGYAVSMCPGSADSRGVSDEAMAAVGGVRRYLADILTEAAEGTSEFIHVG